MARDRLRTRPHPREVPGYAEAQRAGALPRAPQLPPSLLARPTAKAAFYRWAVLVFGGVLVLAVAFAAIARSDLPEFFTFLLFVVVALVFFALVIFTLPSVGRQSLQEFEHGYTTLELSIGGFFPGEGPMTRTLDMRAAWDYSGTWRLDHRDGDVLREPDRSVDPPGMYPSPHRPGKRELWTGATWLGHYAD